MSPTPELNNMMKKKPNQAVKHTKLNLTTNIEGLLKRIEKESQTGLLIDLIILIQYACLKAIKAFYMVTHDTPKPRKIRKKDANC